MDLPKQERLTAQLHAMTEELMHRHTAALIEVEHSDKGFRIVFLKIESPIKRIFLEGKLILEDGKSCWFNSDSDNA